MDLLKLADWWCHWIVYSWGGGKSSANPQLMEGRMICVCLAHCGLRCLRHEQLFQGQRHVQQHCTDVALQLSWSLLCVLYLIPQWVINNSLLITMGAVKDPFFFTAPYRSFWHSPAVQSTAFIKPRAVTVPLGWRLTFYFMDCVKFCLIIRNDVSATKKVVKV